MEDAQLTADFLLLVAAGLDQLSAIEIKRVLQPVKCVQIACPPASDQWAPDGCGSVFPGSAGVTKLHVRVRAPTTSVDWDALRRSFASLKGVQCVLALAGVHSAIPLDALSALPAIEAAASASQDGWCRALDTWRHLNPGRSSNSAPSFRASAVRDGQHDYTSMNVAQVCCLYVRRRATALVWSAREVVTRGLVSVAQQVLVLIVGPYS